MDDLKQYIEYKKGNLPIIFSVPHGGSKLYLGIPRRERGILGIDKNTIQLAKELMDQLRKRLKKERGKERFPSFIISHVPRGKIDMNRVSTKAFPSESQISAKIYNFYHSKLKQFIQYNLKTYNYSLLIDIHGFEKDSRPKGFREVDLILGTNNLQTLFSHPLPKRDWDKNIRGKIIKKLLEREIPIAPGRPKRKEYVLTGGFISKNYGASNIPNSQTIQIEFSDTIRLCDRTHNIEMRKNVLETLVDILYQGILEEIE